MEAASGRLSSLGTVFGVYTDGSSQRRTEPGVQPGVGLTQAHSLMLLPEASVQAGVLPVSSFLLSGHTASN